MSEMIRVSNTMKVAIKIYRENFRDGLALNAKDSDIINFIVMKWLTEEYDDYFLKFNGLNINVEPVKVVPVGLCDDPCCGHCHQDLIGHPDVCPECKAPLDWAYYDDNFSDN